MEIDTNKIERGGARAVEGYIDCCPRLEPFIQTNDKTKSWDGEIRIDHSEQHKKGNLLARVPIQIKGTTNTKDDLYRIEREHIIDYRSDGGCVFFMVQVEDKTYKPLKMLYAMLSTKDLDALLQQTTKKIRIDFNELPADHLDFEKELIKFANERRREPIENSSPKEIAALVNRFKDIEQHLDKAEDKGVKIELKSFLDSIKGLKNDGTVGWRDTFVYLSRKVLELTLQHVKGYDALNLQFELANYLHDQKLYHLVEDYYLQALEEYRKRAKAIPFYKDKVAATLNNLAVLHKDLNQFDAAEDEYNEALDIYRKLAKDNPNAYLPYVAGTLNNLGNLHSDINQFSAAEKEYNEALNIRRKMAKDNPNAYLPDVAMTLNNLATLHDDLNQFDAAEKEYKKALDIRRKLAKDNPDAYLPNVANTLNNLAALHDDFNQYPAAEDEYKEALETYRKLAKVNPNAYLPDVSMTLNNLGNLHSDINQFSAAEKEYKEALEIRRKLANDNPDAYLPDVAMTLFNMALLMMKDVQRKGEAKQACQESLDLFTAMAQKAPQRFNKDVDNAQRLLDEINEL